MKFMYRIFFVLLAGCHFSAEAYEEEHFECVGSQDSSVKVQGRFSQGKGTLEFKSSQRDVFYKDVSYGFGSSQDELTAHVPFDGHVPLVLMIENYFSKDVKDPIDGITFGLLDETKVSCRRFSPDMQR